MKLVSSVDGRARPTLLESGGPDRLFEYVRHDYLTAAAEGIGPQAFLVEMKRPGVVIPPHFHRVEEFQVVVDGGGTLGTHALGTVSAHFADAYTPYGPIVVGREGLKFFTLRPRYDAGANYMPESRAGLIRKARRSVAGSAPLEGAARLAYRSGSAAETLLPAAGDGLAAMLLRVGPRATATGPAPAGGGGQYAVVAGGSARVAGATLPAWSCVWIGPDEPALVVDAGDDGVEIVRVQFPRAA